MGHYATIVSVASFFAGFGNGGLMTATSILLILTPIMSAMFLMCGIGFDLFTSDPRNLLMGFDTDIRPMFGAYISIFSTFLSEVAPTHRLREFPR